jgi:glutamate-1-semialdehyde aminotransferase
MSDGSKFNMNFSGTFNQAQFGTGEQVSMTMNAGAAASQRLTPAELDALRAALARLEEEIAARVPDDRRGMAIAKARDLTDATIGADEPDVGRLKRLRRWFTDNAPEIAGSVASLVGGPLVGTLVGSGAGALQAAFGSGEDDSA